MKKRYRKNYTFVKLIIFLLLTAMVVISFTLSRYKSNVETTATATIALMANNASVSISDNTGKPGKIVTYPITITNFEGKKTCDVKETFKINVSTTNNLPLEIKLYQDENCTKEISKNADGDFEDTTLFNFTGNSKKSITCYLRVQWPQNQNSYTYSNEVDNIKVNAIITQIN